MFILFIWYVVKMSKPEILDKKPLGLAEVKSTIQKIHKRDEELTFRGGKTEDYLNEVTTITKTNAEKAVKALKALDVSRLKEEHIIKIVDVMPKSPEHLKVILTGFNLTLKKEDLSAIVDALDEYQPLK